MSENQLENQPKTMIEIHPPNYDDQYKLLVTDCKAIITEAIFNSRWALVEGYHQLGERIVNDTLYRRSEKNKAGAILSDLIKDIGVSQATLYRAIAFYNKYPSLEDVPEGKNISWNKIITKYLTDSKEIPEERSAADRVIHAAQNYLDITATLPNLDERRQACTDLLATFE